MADDPQIRVVTMDPPTGPTAEEMIAAARQAYRNDDPVPGLEPPPEPAQSAQ